MCDDVCIVREEERKGRKGRGSPSTIVYCTWEGFEIVPRWPFQDLYLHGGDVLYRLATKASAFLVLSE